MTNLERALPHFREAARIFRNVNYMDDADKALHEVAQVEENIRRIRIARAAAAAAAAAAAGTATMG